jgi:hypothetical protein
MDRFRSEEDATLSRVPVFVFPSTVYFNAKERDNLKQILTIYNPYEFPIRFKGSVSITIEFKMYIKCISFM